MRLIDVEQGTEAWLQARLGCPSGSQFGRLVTSTGKPSTQSEAYINELIAERLTGKQTYVKVTEHMERGTLLEPKARSYYEMATDNRVEEVGFCKHDTYECGVSPDGLIGASGGLEIKSPAAHTQVKYLRDGTLPSQYVAQVQGCLWITGREWWDFVAYHEELPAMIVHVERDEDFIQKLEAAVFSACEIIETEIRKLKEI